MELVLKCAYNKQNEKPTQIEFLCFWNYVCTNVAYICELPQQYREKSYICNVADIFVNEHMPIM